MCIRDRVHTGLGVVLGGNSVRIEHRSHPDGAQAGAGDGRIPAFDHVGHCIDLAVLYSVQALKLSLIHI